MLTSPQLFSQTHANGLKVVVAPQPGTGVVAIQVWVGVGSADETEAQGGLAHVHEHMLFKGTSEHGPRGGALRHGVGEIASTIEGAGGDINAWTSYDQTVYHVVIQKDLAHVAIDVLADAVLRSSFDKDELGRELEVILEEIKRSEDSPGQKASRALFASAFSKHPYHRPVIGYANVVRGFTREQIVDFFDTHYRTDRMAVLVVGDIEVDRANSVVQTAFAGAQPGAKQMPARAVEPRQTAARAHVLSEDVQEAQMMVGFAGPSLLDDDMAACDVLSVILGQGESSRLTRILKRDQQICNDAYAYAYTPKDPGLLAVGAHVVLEKFDACLDALLLQTRLMKEQRCRPAELDKAKTLLSSEVIYQKETVEGVARRLGTWMNATGDPAYEQRYQQRVQEVSADDVMRAAQKYLRADGANIVALLPKDQATHITPEHLLARTAAGLAATSSRKNNSSSANGVVCETLPNGARVIIEQDRTNPIVTVRAAWLGGQRGEPEPHAGYTALCAELVVKGTDSLGADAIHDALDNMASSMDGFAGRNSFGLRGTFLQQHAERGLEMFFGCLSDATFLDEELDRTRALVLEELRSKGDNPAGVAFEAFGRALWPTHPYRRDLSGTPDTVRAATRDTLAQFWRTRATAQGCVLCFVGDVDVDRVLDIAASALPERERVLQAAPARDAPNTAAIVVRHDKERAQAHLFTGVQGLTLADRVDKHALELMTAALSGQGGRLFLQLRDKQSLCYSVSASAVEGIDPGSFSVYMGTSPDKVDAALDGINRLLDEVHKDGLTDDEIDRSRRYLIGAHQIGLQRLGSRGTAMALNQLYGLGHLAHREYAQRLQGITSDDVRRVARMILSRPRVTSIVGPKGTQGPPATA